MARILHAVLILFVAYQSSEAIICYSRNGTSMYSSANQLNCSAETTCYNYTTGGSMYYAGCGGCNSLQTSQYNCTNCTRDLCNVPYIKCYAASYATTASALVPTDCFGHTSCYMYYTPSSGFMYNFVGCGNCSAFISMYPACLTCTRNLCNNSTLVFNTGLPRSALAMRSSNQMVIGSVLLLALLAMTA